MTIMTYYYTNFQSSAEIVVEMAKEPNIVFQNNITIEMQNLTTLLMSNESYQVFA